MSAREKVAQSRPNDGEFCVRFNSPNELAANDVRTSITNILGATKGAQLEVTSRGAECCLHISGMTKEKVMQLIASQLFENGVCSFSLVYPEDQEAPVEIFSTMSTVAKTDWRRKDSSGGKLAA